MNLWKTTAVTCYAALACYDIYHAPTQYILQSHLLLAVQSYHIIHTPFTPEVQEIM
jgi:hypothetical protein